MGIAVSAFINEAEGSYKGRPHVTGSSEDIYMGQDMSSVILTAETEAKKMGDDFISVEHLFIALMDKGSTAVEGAS